MTQTDWNFALHRATANEKIRRIEKRRKAEQARRSKRTQNTID